MVLIRFWRVFASGRRFRLMLRSMVLSRCEVVFVGPSARMIIELNIAHYRRLLKTETDASKRQVISKLLAEEQAKLMALAEQGDKSQ